jgi:hypothetical protein
MAPLIQLRGVMEGPMDTQVSGRSRGFFLTEGGLPFDSRSVWGLFGRILRLCFEEHGSLLD